MDLDALVQVATDAGEALGKAVKEYRKGEAEALRSIEPGTVITGQSQTGGTPYRRLVDGEDVGSELCLPGELVLSDEAGPVHCVTGGNHAPKSVRADSKRVLIRVLLATCSRPGIRDTLGHARLTARRTPGRR